MSLYNKQVPIHCCSFGDTHKRKSLVTIAVNHESSPGTSSSPRSTRDFVIQLTREDDPLFVFTMRLTESDYQSLKSEQNLLVDFGGFPRMFTDLVDDVRNEDQKSEPKFVIYFTEHSASSGQFVSDSGHIGTLEIVESNRFKHLVHLSLRLNSATDSELKKHLALRLQTLKQEFSNYKSASQSTDAELRHKLKKTEQNFIEKVTEVEKMKTLRQDEVKRLKQQHAQALSSAQEKLEKEQKQLTDENRNVSEQIRTLETQCEQMQDEVAGLQASVDRLTAGNEQLEDECQQWQERYTAIEQELDEIAVLRDQIGDMEHDLRSRESDIERGEEKLRALIDHKRKLEDQLSHQKAETEKGLDVIDQLLHKNHSYDKKARYHTQMLEQQEEHVKQIENERKQFKEQLDNLSDTEKNLNEQNQKLTNQVSELNEKLQKYDKESQSKDSLISYLNRQLSELKLSIAGAGPLSPPNTLRPTQALSALPNFRPVLGVTSTSTPLTGKTVSRVGAVGFSPVLSTENRPPTSRTLPAQLLEPNL